MSDEAPQGASLMEIAGRMRVRLPQGQKKPSRVLRRLHGTCQASGAKAKKIRGTPSRRRPCKTETVFRSEIIFARSNVIGQQLLRQIIRNPQRTAWTSFGYHALMSWMM